METTITSLNPTQQFILRTFATIKTEKDKEELISFYLDYIQCKLDREINKWWEENKMTEENIEELLNTHYRIPYK